ncbi:MAG: HAD hydrolase family protein, partial [Candidatus Zixiibacteriota bacterium]
KQLTGIKGVVHILDGDIHNAEKARYLAELGAEKCAALGNGNNDAAMLAAAKIGIAVMLEEGCSAAALKSADIFVRSAADALALLLNPARLKATLRH